MSHDIHVIGLTLIELTGCEFHMMEDCAAGSTANKRPRQDESLLRVPFVPIQTQTEQTNDPTTNATVGSPDRDILNLSPPALREGIALLPPLRENVAVPSLKRKTPFPITNIFKCPLPLSKPCSRAENLSRIYRQDIASTLPLREDVASPPLKRKKPIQVLRKKNIKIPLPPRESHSRKAKEDLQSKQSAALPER